MKCPFKKQVIKEFSYKPWGSRPVDKENVTIEFGNCDETQCMAYNLASMKCDLKWGCEHE